jgi:hypothetical protein
MPDPAMPAPAIPDPGASNLPRRSGYSPDATNCLFATILSYLYPFYALAADGDIAAACTAVALLIKDNRPSGPVETDLAGRLVGYGIAAIDNLRLSLQPGLSDTKILQYRAGAVALGRSAEQCRKRLDAMQAERRVRHGAVASRPVPIAPPSPSVPPRPSAPPRESPPAQPHASAPSVSAGSPPASPSPAVALPPASAAPPASALPATGPLPLIGAPLQPVVRLLTPGDPACAYPDSMVEGDPAFAVDIEVMKRNTHAMLADLQARAKQFGHDAPEALLAQMTLERGPPGQLQSAAAT